MKRRTKGLFLLAGAIFAEVTGSLSLKGALEYPVLYAVVAIAYVTAFTLLGYVLRTGMTLGVAYGIWGACGVALTALFSSLIYGETVTLSMGIGIIVVIVGVLCVEFGSHAGKGEKKVAA